MILGEVGWGDVDWIGLVQDMNRWRALVNSVLNLRVPPPSVSGLSGKCGILNLSNTYGSLQPVTRIALTFFLFLPTLFRISSH
jgi:hypothetical protein